MEQEPLVIMFNLNNTNLTQEDYFILENVIGYTLNILIFAMLIPQIYKAYKNKMTDDISYKFIWISLVAEVLEILYGVLINQIPVLLTGIICMIQMILLYIAKKLYDNPQNIKIQRRTSIQDSNLIEISDITQTQTQTQTITQAIKYMWDNKKDDSFMEEIQNHKLISMSQNIEKSSCKLQLHIDEFKYFIKKALEQIIREPQRRLQILTNTFKTYNPEEPYIKKEHELIFSNEDINKLLQSDISKYELSQFVNNVRFFDVTYSNQIHSKLKDFQISGYNGLDMYNKSINTIPENISKQVTFSFINTTNEDKSYLYRGGNKMTNKRLNELKQKIDMINKRENIRLLDSNTQKNVSYEPL